MYTFDAYALRRVNTNASKCFNFESHIECRRCMAYHGTQFRFVFARFFCTSRGNNIIPAFTSIVTQQRTEACSVCERRAFLTMNKYAYAPCLSVCDLTGVGDVGK